MKKTNVFTDIENKEYTVKGHINCRSENVVYSIFCRICDKTVYVGQTESLYQRMLLNFSMIRTKKSDAVAIHFNSRNHSSKDLIIRGIEKIYGEDTFRKIRESFWIKKLNTVQPNGLNTQIEF